MYQGFIIFCCCCSLVVFHMNMPSFVFYSSTDGHLAGVQFLATINKATVTILAQNLFGNTSFVLGVNTWNQVCLVIRELYCSERVSPDSWFFSFCNACAWLKLWLLPSKMPISNKHIASHRARQRARLPSPHWGSFVWEILVDLKTIWVTCFFLFPQFKFLLLCFIYLFIYFIIFFKLIN